MIIFIFAKSFLNIFLYLLSSQVDFLLSYHRKQYFIFFLLVDWIRGLFGYFSHQERVGNCSVLLIFLRILWVLFFHRLYSNQGFGSFFGIWNKFEGFETFSGPRICIGFTFFSKVSVKKHSWRFGFGGLCWVFGAGNAKDGLSDVNFRIFLMNFEWNGFFLKLRFWCHFFVLFIKISN